jgi:hypothetical protein
MVYLLDIVIFHMLNDPTVLMAIDGYWLVVGIAGWTGSPTNEIADDFGNEKLQL